MIGVGMMDRIILLEVQSRTVDTSYGGENRVIYTPQEEIIYAHVVWRGGDVIESGQQMQNNQMVEFYCRNGGVMARSNVKDRIIFDSDIFWIDAIDVIDGRENYLRVITTQVSPTNPQV
jgi:hypothetical protein